MFESELIPWTVRLALVLCLWRLMRDLMPGIERPGRRYRSRWLWTGAYLLLVVHVGLAFHLVHHWSHAAAWEETARQTAAVTGWHWGGGIWWNYLLLVLWGGDLAWWWLAPDSWQRRPRWVALCWHGYLLFLAFNATVVFASGPIRWAGIVGTLLFGAVLLWSALRQRGPRQFDRSPSPSGRGPG